MIKIYQCFGVTYFASSFRTEEKDAQNRTEAYSDLHSHCHENLESYVIPRFKVLKLVKLCDQ
jgi:hypothetical protein